MRALTVVLAIFLSGCGRDVHTPFTGPADEVKSLPVTDTKGSRGPFCAPDAIGKYPGTLVEVSVEKKETAFNLGVGGGCVLRPMREVWAVMQNPDALSSSGSKRLGFDRQPPETVTLHLRGKFEAGPPLFVQNWTIDWKHSLKEGTVEDPKRVVIRYQKVQGTHFIKHWEGEIELVALAPGVTSFSMRNEIEAPRTGPKEAADTVRDHLKFARTLPPVWDFLKK